MSRLKKVLESGAFAVTAETEPPKGIDYTAKMAKLEALRGVVDAVNVTDMQSATLHMTALGLCIRLKQVGIDTVMHMTGRDRNRMALLGDLLMAASFGIDNMLSVTGDHPVRGDWPDVKPVYDLDSVGILRMMAEFETAQVPDGASDFPKLSGPFPKFYKGVCVNPVYEPEILQINKLRQKVEAGADFVQTQGVYDFEDLLRFMDDVDRFGIKVHVLAGIIPLKSARMAVNMNKNVPGIDVPQSMIDVLAEAEKEGKAKGVKGLPMRAGISMAAELAAKIKDSGVFSGIHIMTIGAEQNVPEIVKEAGI